MKNINNNLSSRATHHSSSRSVSMRDIVVGFFNAPLYPGLQISGMTNGAGAFTLIELLVVVLIIGILAAVALPQYTLAVNKSRFANLRSMAQPYIKAMEAYHLANGTWPGSFDELNVDAPAGLTKTTLSDLSAECTHNDEVFCCLRQKTTSKSASITCGQKDYSFAYVYFPETSNSARCLAKATKTNADQLCKSLNGSYTKNAGLLTPDREKSNYNYYTIKL